MIGELESPEWTGQGMSAAEKERFYAAQIAREKQYHSNGMQYINRIKEQLEEAVKEEHASKELKEDCESLLAAMNGHYEPAESRTNYVSPLSPTKVGDRVNKLLEKGRGKQ